MWCVIILYAVMKGDKVWGYGDSSIVYTKADSYFNSSYEMSSDRGMTFAFGITHYDGDKEPVDDGSYGQVVARFVTWGLDPNNGSTQVSPPIPTKRCSDEDLRLSGDNSKFYPAHMTSERDLNTYKKKLWCFDFDKFADAGLKDALEVQGDYNSDKARTIKMTFEKCNPETFSGTCQSDENISKWLVRKFFLVLEN